MIVLAQTRSEVELGGRDSYCVALSQVVSAAHTRSEVSVGAVAWYLPALGSHGVRALHTRLALVVGADVSYSAVVHTVKGAHTRSELVPGGVASY